MTLPLRLQALSALAVVLAVALLGGCKRKPAPNGPPPDPRHYAFVHFVHDVTVAGVDHPLALGDRELLGATVVVDGTPQPMPIEESGSGDVTASVALDPGHAFADHSVKLALRFPSPCGTPVELAVDYTSSDTSGKVELRRAKTSAVAPGAFTVWVDDTSRPSAKITFGKLEVAGRIRDEHSHADRPGRRMRLWDVGCAPDHAVMVDGKLLGRATPAGGKETAFLVSPAPGTCYEKRVAEYVGAYRPTSAPDTVEYVAAAPITDVGWASLDYFLTRAPSGSESSSLWGITKVPCDDTRAGTSDGHHRRATTR